ncbi:hypothetical protein MCOR14_008350, partial [Pyricularia oryzae]
RLTDRTVNRHLPQSPSTYTHWLDNASRTRTDFNYHHSRTGDTQGGPRMRSCIPNTSYNTDANSSPHLHQVRGFDLGHNQRTFLPCCVGHRACPSAVEGIEYDRYPTLIVNDARKILTPVRGKVPGPRHGSPRQAAQSTARRPPAASRITSLQSLVDAMQCI